MTTANSSKTAQPPMQLPVRVYWEDTDAGGVVYYANYLRFFERARTEWLRAMGVEQRQLQTDTHTIFVVANMQLRYVAPARLDDELLVTVELVELGNASITLRQAVRRGDVLLVEATVRVGCVDALSLKPRRIPAHVLQPMLDGGPGA